MTEAGRPPKNTGRWRDPLLFGLLASSLATAASYFAPASQASTLVGLIFLAFTTYLCRRGGESPSDFGLSFGGLFDPEPLSARRMAQETWLAFLVALLVAMVVLPLFTIGYLLWFEPRQAFAVERAFRFGAPTGVLGILDLVLAHLLVVALPEEAFFRGYMQTSLTRALRSDSGWRVHLPNLIASSVFALGHYATDPVPGRLAVFFPSLLFGLLRTYTGGIGASVFFHTFSNLYSAFLAAGFGFGR